MSMLYLLVKLGASRRGIVIATKGSMAIWTHLRGGGSQNVAHAYVLDSNKGGKTNTTGTITPDVTL